MSKTLINVEQSEYWNEKSGPKWVKIDDAINERFSVLTDEFFRSKNVQNDRVLDVDVVVAKHLLELRSLLEAAVMF